MLQNHTTQCVVWKNRTNIVRFVLGMDVSNDTFTSQIRKTPESDVILATWDISFETDGTDGALLLRLEPADLASVDEPTGIMDLRRLTSGGDELQVSDWLEVDFRQAVTR